MRIPIASYRLQFNAAFTFEDARAIAPYLSALGISDVYASPILQARQGSTHGYDGVDPMRMSEELGGHEKFELLSGELRSHHLGWIQDIVPNHMAFDSQNAMLMDVLEHGPDSRYVDFFDIDWKHSDEGIYPRVLAPFLGQFYGDCLESGELRIDYDQSGFSINYYSLQFPIRIESYYRVLTYSIETLRKKLGREHPDYLKLLGALYVLKYVPFEEEEGQERYDQVAFVKRMLWELWNDAPDVKAFIQTNLQSFNGEPGNPESFNLLDDLLKEQFFRLSYWKVGNEELNYRRFFTVNDLISLRVEDEQVFQSVHGLILAWVNEGIITGLRIDHIDGLYDPAAYLARLREEAPEVYLVVEKILEPGELLPLNWPVQGTTGYDFLNQVNGIFCNADSVATFDQIYRQILGSSISYQALIDEKKRLIASKHLAGDIDNLAQLLKKISGRYRHASDFTIFGLKAALVEILVVFPVYRTYINRDGASLADQDCIKAVMRQAKKNIPNFLNELSFVEKFLRLKFDESLSDEDREQWLGFLMRMQQLTGPLMAKGVEDTVLYIYNRLLSLNEVGSLPNHFGISVEQFHAFNQVLATQWPHTMNATATHDTKRGEDVRMRLNVLSEVPELWQQHLEQWQQLNVNHRVDRAETGDDEAGSGWQHPIPDPNDEYFFYQTLVGIYPFESSEAGDRQNLLDRIKDYLIKAIREAKVHTAWLKPDAEYEAGFLQFADRVLDDRPDNPFLQSFLPFVRKIQHHGALNSLSQTLLKFTVPGVPDIYQGTELWDLSLVDPDNRRPVDYAFRFQLLQDLQEQEQADAQALWAELLQNYADGRIKLFLTHKLLQARQQYQDLFLRGAYQKLTVSGSLKSHVVTFVRELGQQQMIAIAPRLTAALAPSGEFPVGEQVWYETRLQPPVGSGPRWRDLITGRVIVSEEMLWLRDLLQRFPVALWLNESEA
ncbi:MAG: malto-oligosyltrehalose synthase [Synechococcales cyanobacterium RU_4_20]|nr:malto-oligosyltrehalose synthase [Synechococcales cyanobacterium RU_4_20]